MWCLLVVCNSGCVCLCVVCVCGGGVSVAWVGFRTKKPKKIRWGELNPGQKSGSPGQIPLCYCGLVVLG